MSFNRVSLIVDLRYVLVLLRVEKVRSHFAVLTGRVRASCNKCNSTGNAASNDLISNKTSEISSR